MGINDQGTIVGLYLNPTAAPSRQPEAAYGQDGLTAGATTHAGWPGEWRQPVPQARAASG
jgi:hypothetical protein